MNTSLTRLLILALAGGLVLSCQLPTTPLTPRSSGVTLHFTPPSRTVGADWANLISTYEVVMSKTSNPAEQVTGSTDPGDSFLTLTGVEAGTWDIAVTAKTLGGTKVAEGSLLGQSLPQPQSLTIDVLPLTSGVGDFAYTVRFLQPSVPIEEVHGQLYTLAGVPFGSAYQFLDSEGEFVVDGSYRSVTFIGSDLAPGAYRLSVTFVRVDGQPARSLSEAINIGGAVSSDVWIAPDGGVYASRDLTLADFVDTVSSLADLALTTDNLTFTGGAPYTYSGTPNITLKAHSTSSTQTLTFTPTISRSGQAIRYSLDDGTTWAGILSGTSQTMALVAGTNTLLLEVTAPDRFTKTLYDVEILKSIDVSSLTLVTDIALPVGSNQTLIPTILPANATDKSVTWTTSDAAIATVDASGKVTGVAAGTAIITATSVNGGRSDTTTVTVTGSGTLTLSPLGYGALGFSAVAATIDEGDDLILTVDSGLAAEGTGWTAYFEGGALPLHWATNLVLETASLPAGQHFLDVFVTWNGVTYSGSLPFTILSVGEP